MNNTSKKKFKWTQLLLIIGAFILIADIPPSPSGCSSKNSDGRRGPQPIEEDGVPAPPTEAATESTTEKPAE